MVNKFKNIKPLVIGIGVAGKRHLEAQLDLGIKTGVYTTNPQTAKSLKKQSNIIVFDNLQDAINWSNLVHICTPDDKHTEFVAEAVKKRKAVLCEKAFTTNLKDALYLQKLAHKYGTAIIVGQNYRLTPTFAETKKRIQEGQLGKLIRIKATYFHHTTEYKQKYSTKDFLYIGGSHAVDLVYWIAGEDAINIKASSKNELNYKITCIFASGLTGYIELDASSPRLINGTDLIVEGEYGKLISHNKFDQLLYYRKDNKNPQTINLANNQTLTTALEVRIIDNYLLGTQNSYWPLPDVDEALNTIKVLDAIQNQ
ncbi:Gfo/Idh/MocA family oxidoreductase [Patescibacteria group bacterium]|nr:Gfo/Idh/MocA family oxidoreductase [Patescibacteria group bacterium]